jgi:oxygen-independent coproporphyrinogen III oxidase
VAGIYVHIPFCRRKCRYCNFFSVGSSKYKDAFFDTLMEEIFLQRKYLKDLAVSSVYFGGGTPSFINPGIIGKILTSIRGHYTLTADPEITIEVNPDDVTPDVLQEYRKLGITRLSIGVQSFSDDDLVYLDRVHSADQARKAIEDAQAAGFSNLSIDLIYGIPTLTKEKWLKNLQEAFAFGVPHISAYSLTVEEKTALDVMIRRNEMKAPVEEEVVEQFRMVMEQMRAHGYHHYEISNFAKAGFYSHHNSMYWSGEHYLGLGPSAHSFNGGSRQWNVGSILQYIDLISRNDRFYESEELTIAQKYNEKVMVSIRTMWGCDLNKIREEFGEEIALHFSGLVKQHVKSGHIIEKKSIYYLTDEGKLYADRIASDLFLEPEDDSQG